VVVTEFIRPSDCAFGITVASYQHVTVMHQRPNE
jgi:hypothetical protein